MREELLYMKWLVIEDILGCRKVINYIKKRYRNYIREYLFNAKFKQENSKKYQNFSR
jgi:hypothetical protein